MKARLAIVSLDVLDMDRALAFYRDVMGFPVTFARRGEPWLQLSLGTCQLALKQVAERAAVARPPFSLYLQVDDLAHWLEHLRAHNVPLEGEPVSKEGLYTVVVARDPEGNRLHLFEMKQDHSAMLNGDGTSYGKI